jgi:hypothetical protein
MSDSISKAVQYLSERDIGFHVTHPNPGGLATIAISPAEVVQYASDPVAYLARHYKVSREDYLGWHQSEYKVQCSAITSKGVRCKATAAGLSAVYSPQEWVNGQGSCCPIHC